MRGNIHRNYLSLQRHTNAHTPTHTKAHTQTHTHMGVINNIETSIYLKVFIITLVDRFLLSKLIGIAQRNIFFCEKMYLEHLAIAFKLCLCTDIEWGPLFAISLFSSIVPLLYEYCENATVAAIFFENLRIAKH